MDTTDTPLRPLTGLQQAVIALAMVSMGAGMTINFVVVSPLARDAGLTELQVAGILTFSAALYAFTIPIWGRLADNYGRKRVMIFSLCAMATTNMAFLFGLNAALTGVVTGTMSFLLLAFIRLWFGILAPGMQPAAMATMTDATTPQNRAAGLGMLGAAMGIGSIIGPAGATVLSHFGALAPLWGTIVFCYIVAIVLAFALPPTRTTRAALARPAPLSVFDKRVMPHLVFLFTYFVGVGMIQQTLAWFIQDRYGFVDTATRTAREQAVFFTGLIFTCMAVALLVVQFGYVTPRKPDPRRMLPVGLGLVTVGYIMADSVQPFWALCVAFTVVGVGAALAVPAANAMGSLSVPRPSQGGAAALLAMAPPSGFIFGPLLGASLYAVDHRYPLYASALLMGVLCIYAFMVTAKRPLNMD